MQGKCLLHSIVIERLLSYGREGDLIPLEPLNVLIGPNGSGKSNLIDAIGLLAAAPRDLAGYVSERGGVQEWLWKGAEHSPSARIRAHVGYPMYEPGLGFDLAFSVMNDRLEIQSETIYRQPGPNLAKPETLYDFVAGRDAWIKPSPPLPGEKPDHEPDEYQKQILRDRLQPGQSILSQVRSFTYYPAITYLSDTFRSIRFFRKWSLGADFLPRHPQRTNLPPDFLLEDASNLAVVLQALKEQPDVWACIIEKLRMLYEPAEDVEIIVLGETGFAELRLREAGLASVTPAARLSDGTLRYLCLLAILCHPQPPPLICLEEPELGMHPDLLHVVADLLVEASQRTQLIVATHSDGLVAALSEVPQAVAVCARDERGTRIVRYSQEQLKAWLKDYTLGDLWRKGVIGGNRW